MKNVADVYPLTPTQAGMLFHALEAPDSGVYFEQVVCTLFGQLDIDAFRQAWHTVVHRHAVLRTVFIWEGIDEPLQVVRQTVEIPFVHQDWCVLTRPEQDDRLATYLRQDRARSFDLAKAPLLRLALFELETNVHQMVWSFHHLQLDGWSTALVLKEVFTCYEALHRDEVPESSAPRPFREYIGWLKRQDIDQAEAFWRKELAGFATPTALPVGSGANANAHAGSYKQFGSNLSEQLTTRLQQLAQQQRLTINTIVQGAWAILLSRYSGERDVLFGATVSGRPADLPGVEAMIGMFINTLPLRVQVEPDAELLPWLQAIQSRQLALSSYSYSPLPEILAWSDVPSGQALFDTLVVFENYPVDGSVFQYETPSLRVDDVRYLEQSNYPLGVLVVPGRQLRLLIPFDSSIFDDGVIGRLLGHLEMVLSGIAADVHQPLGAMRMLADAEQQQILNLSGNTQPDTPRPPQIQHYVEQHARDHPDAVAVVDTAGQLTYRELDRRANQLAHYLQELGVGANTPVGLLLERSNEMVVAILGVLKAGGAYLPLDPAYPEVRLAFMVADTGAPVVVAQKRWADLLPDCEAQTVFMDAEWAAIAREDGVAPSIAAVPENLAYVIYTSGSTGMPNGVPVSHRNLVHFVLTCFDFHERPVERFLLLSSFSFDSSMDGIFWTLCQGGTLVLPPQRIALDVQQLATTIAAHQITHVLMLPSLYAILLEHADPAQLASLQTVIVAGEECRPSMVDRHYTLLPHAPLYNEYGPTEATVWSTGYKIPPDFEGDRVPIGRSILNVQNYILDRFGHLAPIGVPGELCIGGAGVTLGYLDRPELTAKRFVEHTFAGKPPIRLYHTGDLARYLPDGNIEFLGRIDHQVKIRGFRVEVGEIETVLNQHVEVREAVVVARDAAPGDKRLVAYVAPVQGQSPAAGELRSFLKARLPDSMVPSAYVLLEAFPLTPNGKVDRRSLPAPGALGLDADETRFVAPRTGTEETVAGIWAEVLGRERVGIYDNFFDLGGHSLSVTRVVSRLRDTFQIDLPLSKLFDLPTVSDLSEHVDIVCQTMHPLKSVSKGADEREVIVL